MSCWRELCRAMASRRFCVQQIINYVKVLDASQQTFHLSTHRSHAEPSPRLYVLIPLAVDEAAEHKEYDDGLEWSIMPESESTKSRAPRNDIQINSPQSRGDDNE